MKDTTLLDNFFRELVYKLNLKGIKTHYRASYKWYYQKSQKEYFIKLNYGIDGVIAVYNCHRNLRSSVAKRCSYQINVDNQTVKESSRRLDELVNLIYNQRKFYDFQKFQKYKNELKSIGIYTEISCIAKTTKLGELL